MTASLLGVIAQHSVASPPPATVVAPRRVGKPVSTAFSNGPTSVTAALPQTPTAGNLLVAICMFDGLSTTTTCGTPAGWTAGPFQRTTTGAGRLGLFLFWKLATGSESNPAFAINTATTGGIILQEWTGLDTTAPHVADSAGAQVIGNGNITLTDAITTSTANEWVFTAIGSVNATNTMNPVTWTLPQLSFDQPTHSLTQVKTTNSTAAWAAGCYPTAGVKAPQAAATLSAGTASSGIVSMSFKLAAGSRPQVFESAFTEYGTVNAGTWTATLATAPDPADVLICAVEHADTLGAVSISGCGATWTLKESHDDSTSGSKYDIHIWTGINPTGAGAVTVTSANGRTGKIRVLRVSGVGQSVSTAYSRTTGLSATGPTVVAGPTQLVVAVQAVSGTGTSDSPISSASPALGNWATDAMLFASTLSGSAQDGWTTPAATGTSCNVTGATSVSSRDWCTAMVAVG